MGNGRLNFLGPEARINQRVFSALGAFLRHRGVAVFREQSPRSPRLYGAGVRPRRALRRAAGDPGADLRAASAVDVRGGRAVRALLRAGDGVHDRRAHSAPSLGTRALAERPLAGDPRAALLADDHLQADARLLRGDRVLAVGVRSQP